MLLNYKTHNGSTTDQNSNMLKHILKVSQPLTNNLYFLFLSFIDENRRTILTHTKADYYMVKPFRPPSVILSIT